MPVFFSSSCFFFLFLSSSCAVAFRLGSSLPFIYPLVSHLYHTHTLCFCPLNHPTTSSSPTVRAWPSDNTSEPQVVTLDSPRPFPIAQVLSDPALHATTNPDFAGLLEKASQAYLEVEREKTKRREAWFGKMDIQAKVKAAANMVEENGSVVDQAR